MHTLKQQYSQTVHHSSADLDGSQLQQDPLVCLLHEEQSHEHSLQLGSHAHHSPSVPAIPFPPDILTGNTTLSLGSRHHKEEPPNFAWLFARFPYHLVLLPLLCFWTASASFLLETLPDL
jgi:hypothetical protein